MNKLTILFLILASNITINVYSQTISTDNTFGQNGIVKFANASSVSLLDFDTHGNIIAAGYTIIGEGKYHLTIAKTNADGVIDETFGNNGLVKITDYDQSIPYGLKITNDNKIIVIGRFIKLKFQGAEILIMRFNEDGSIDENFGDNGKINLDFNPNTSNILSFNLESNDFILVSKQESEAVEMNGSLHYIHIGYSITKYNYEIKIDKTFGEDGVVFLPNEETKNIAPYCMKILNNNSIIIAGTCNTQPNIELGLCKLTSNGYLDTDFANNGIWHKNIIQDFYLDHESFNSIFEDNEGNLILSGSGLTNSLGWSNRSFLSKFTANGTLDTNFGEDGFYCFDSVSINKSVIQIGNKYLSIGLNSLKNHYQITIVDNDGNDANVAYNCKLYYFHDIKLQRENKLILGGGLDYANFNDNFALERLIIDSEAFIELNSNYSKNIVIFPNPVKKNLYFNKEVMFEIIDIQGKTLLTSATPTKTANIENLKAGIYFVRCGNNIQRFIKE